MIKKSFPWKEIERLKEYIFLYFIYRKRMFLQKSKNIFYLYWDRIDISINQKEISTECEDFRVICIRYSRDYNNQ